MKPSLATKAAAISDYLADKGGYIQIAMDLLIVNHSTVDDTKRSGGKNGLE